MHMLEANPNSQGYRFEQKKYIGCFKSLKLSGKFSILSRINFQRRYRNQRRYGNPRRVEINRDIEIKNVEN